MGKVWMHKKLVAVRMLKKIRIKQKRCEKIFSENIHNKLEAVRLLKKIRIQQRLLAEKQENFAQAQKILLEKIDIATKQLTNANKGKTNGIMEVRRRLAQTKCDDFRLNLLNIPCSMSRRP